MDWFNNFEQIFRQLSEFPSMVFNNFNSTLSGMQNMNFYNTSENYLQSMKLQEDLVKNFLDFQEQISRFSIDTQRKFWDSYFKMMRRS